MGSNDHGVSDETFCGGAPDDEAPEPRDLTAMRARAEEAEDWLRYAADRLESLLAGCGLRPWSEQYLRESIADLARTLRQASEE